MNQLVKFGLMLAVICLVATLVLAVTYEVTKPQIEAQMRKEEEAALKAIMPDADSFDARKAGDIEYFEARRGGEKVGYCLKVTASGYNGYIRLMAGIDKNGVIEGVEVLEQHETPGLGSRIEEVKPGDTAPWFLRQFKGKKASSVYVGKNIDAITGATISSRAVTKAVRETADQFMATAER